MEEQTRRLLLAIENANIEIFKQEWTTSCADGTALLHEAVSAGRFDIIQFMLENGADPNSRAFPEKATPLMFGWLIPRAVRLVSHRILLRHGANPHLRDASRIDAFRAYRGIDYMESYLMAELVCGEADNFPIDLWRIVKPFIYNI